MRILKSNNSFLAIAALVASCGVEPQPQPEPMSSVSDISGTVYYAGDAHTRLAKPALEVSAFVTFPPTGPPHASVVQQSIAFDAQGVSYTMPNVPEFGYFVVAQIVDLADTDAFVGPAAGGYPDFCALGDPQQALQIESGTSATGVDITLYDRSGSDDPCNSPSEAPAPEPEPTATMLRVNLTSLSIASGPSDKVSVALFSSYPPRGPPSGAQSVASTGFPQDLMFEDVPPGDYYVSGCFDKDGDSTFCNGPGDVVRFHAAGAEPVTVRPGTVTTIDIPLP